MTPESLSRIAKTGLRVVTAVVVEARGDPRRGLSVRPRIPSSQINIWKLVHVVTHLPTLTPEELQRCSVSIRSPE
jgi:hypothetical protein